MTIAVQRPSGVNVGVSNPGTSLYLKGNENTDGSQRWNYPEPGGPPQMEARINGVWVTAFVVDRPVGQFVFDGNGEQVTV